MNKIETVSGPVYPEELGFCQCHEHIFIRDGRPAELNPLLRMDCYDKSLSELKRYHDTGDCSIVDAQPVGCGRMARLLRDASIESGVYIIASTGFHKLTFYDDDHWIHQKDEDFLTRLFIDELENGMYIDGDHGIPIERTDAKPGIIKVAVDSFGIDDAYMKLLNAAANASLCTGAPILCHIEKGSDAACLIKYFTDKNIKPSSIILCHLDRVRYDIQYHKEIAKTGVYLEYDTIGRFKKLN